MSNYFYVIYGTGNVYCCIITMYWYAESFCLLSTETFLFQRFHFRKRLAPLLTIVGGEVGKGGGTLTKTSAVGIATAVTGCCLIFH